jgi:hypothetical protein
MRGLALILFLCCTCLCCAPQRQKIVSPIKPAAAKVYPVHLWAVPEARRVPGNYGAPGSSAGGGTSSSGAGSSAPANPPVAYPPASNSDPSYTCRMGSGGEVEANCRKAGYL